MKKNINRKKIIIVIIILAVLIFCIIQIFIKKTIKNSKIGNNSSSQDVVNYILNINSYEAEINVEINSNKNNNKYIYIHKLKIRWNIRYSCCKKPRK